MRSRWWFAIMISVIALVALSACDGMIVEIGVETETPKDSTLTLGSPVQATSAAAATAETTPTLPPDFSPEIGVPTPDPIPAETDPLAGRGGDMRGEFTATITEIIPEPAHGVENPIIAVLRIESVDTAEEQVFVYGMTEIIWQDATPTSLEALQPGMVIFVEGAAGFRADRITIQATP